MVVEEEKEKIFPTLKKNSKVNFLLGHPEINARDMFTLYCLVNTWRTGSVGMGKSYLLALSWSLKKNTLNL